MKQISLALAAAWLITLALAPAAAARSQKAIWGPVWMPNGEPAFSTYQDLGVQVFQVQLRWNHTASSRPADPTNPDDPAYRWPKVVDEAVRAGREYRIQVAIMVRDSPAWANGGRAPRWVPNDADYARFLTAASRRYRSVRRWMVWGEVNRRAVFQPLPRNSRRGPRRYATLLRAAFGALKGRDRRNVVIGGMTFSYGDVSPRDFLRWMRLPDGKPPPLDNYGHNPFARRFPRLGYYRSYRGYGSRDFSDLGTFAKELRRTYKGRYRAFRRRGPKLWLSEFTISSDRPNRAFDFFVSRRQQARWLVAAYRIARREPYVAALGWFSLLDDPAVFPNRLTTGLMTYEGRRKPAYYAYRRAR